MYLPSPRCLLRLTLLVFLIGIILLPTASAAFKHLQDGMAAPDLEGVDLLTGEKVQLETGGDLDVTVVVFWATWSERSLELLRDLKEMAGDFKGKPFRVIAINVEQEKISSEMKEMIVQTVQELELPFPVILDNGLSLFYLYGVIAIPSTALLDGKLTMRFGPGGYSYTIRDELEDSTKVLLGLTLPSSAPKLLSVYEPKLEASRYYQLAVRLTEKRMYERALANLDKALTADSLFSAPHNLRGHILLRLKDPSAGDAFRLAVMLQDSSVAAWAGWGRALLAGGDPDQAIGKLETALDFDRTYVPALVDLALCQLDRGDTEEALVLLEEAHDLNPRDLSVLYHLGRLSLMNGDQMTALDTFHTALKILYPSP